MSFLTMHKNTGIQSQEDKAPTGPITSVTDARKEVIDQLAARGVPNTYIDAHVPQSNAAELLAGANKALDQYNQDKNARVTESSAPAAKTA